MARAYLDAQAEELAQDGVHMQLFTLIYRRTNGC